MKTYSFKPYFYYTYRITNLQENKHYYGSKYSEKTATVQPKEHIGSIYISSSLDKEFIQHQKENPHLYKYKVIKVYNTPEQAIALEIKLHAKFDVRNHPSFYNKSNQTSTKFKSSRESVEKSKASRLKIGEDGLNSYQRCAPQTSKTRSKIEENGKTISQNASIAAAKTMSLITENGKTIRENATEKMTETITKVNKNGKTIAQERRVSGAKTMKDNGSNALNKHHFAKIIQIFDSENNLKFECQGNYKRICKEFNLPVASIEISFRNNTALNKKTLRNKFKHLDGWYAIDLGFINPKN